MIFVVGPSGGGKSEVSNWIAADLQFLHLDIDRRHGFGANGLRPEWHKFSSRLDVAPLAARLRDRVAVAERSGTVLSFPSTRVLTRAQIDTARRANICTVVLWGPEAFCKEARRARELENWRTLDDGRYEKANRKAFDTYGRSEYADLRVEAFLRDGSRWPRDHMTAMIRRRIAG